VTDIIRELEKPGRDPRPEFKTANFQEGVEKITDLKPGMVLEATVTNVAAFGAFADSRAPGRTDPHLRDVRAADRRSARRSSSRGRSSRSRCWRSM